MSAALAIHAPDVLVCPAGMDCGRVNCDIEVDVPCPQGYFCPPGAPISVCPGGYQCPWNGMSAPIPCDAGYFCPGATVVPIRCDPLSLCSEKSSKAFSFTGVALVAAILAAVCVVVCLFRRRDRKRRERSASQRPPELHAGAAAEVSHHKDRLHRRGSEPAGAAAADTDDDRTALLPHAPRPAAISFADLTFRIGKRGTIVDHVSGSIRVGRLTAILGPSGAGKTTFLNLILHKLKPTSGSVSRWTDSPSDGIPGSSLAASTRGRVGFVPQDDIMLSMMTVRETLTHAAATRNLSVDRVASIVETTIAFLGLAHVADSIIGDEYLRGISGGEKKRVSIGMELVAETSILALDEPTSGLDATAAESVVQLLARIVASNRTTIIAVVHQPRYEVFNAFDDVILLGKGGRLVYCGPRDQLLEYFSRLGFDCPDKVNPPDFIMDTLSSPLADSRIPVFFSPDEQLPLAPASAAASSSMPTASTVSFLRQLPSFMVRPLICILRLRKQLLISCLMHLVAGAMTGVSYMSGSGLFQPPIPYEYYASGVCPSAVSDQFCGAPVKDDVGILAGYIIMAVSLVAVAVAGQTFGDERLVYFREASSGQSALAYCVGKCFWDLPMLMIYAALFVGPLHAIISPAGSIWHYYLDIACLEFCIYGVTYVLSMFVRRENLTLVGLVITMTWGTTCGIAVKVNDMGIFGTLSYPRWAGEAIYVTEVRLDYMSASQAQAVRYFVDHFFYNYVFGQWWYDLGMMIMYGVVFRIAAFVAMKLCHRSKQI